MESKHLVRIFILLVAVACVGVFYGNRLETVIYTIPHMYRQLSANVFGSAVDPGRSPNAIKKILLWNSPGRIEVAAFGTGHQVFIDAGCPVADCSIEVNSTEFWTSATSDPGVFQTFDAVVINMHELWMSFLPAYIRPPFQRMVFLTQESPQTLMYFDPALYDNFFNWTMSYRLDSDVRLLYGRTVRRPTITGHFIEAFDIDRVRNKTKKVAWMVSHCVTYSKREELAAELQKYIDIDIYGGCGNFSCERNDSHWLSHPQCYDQLDLNYKFYLSFENSLCQDYATEKFFNILQHHMVPVVYGSADYADIAPPYSYIDARNFTDARALAEYLHYLDDNEEEYVRYFEWKASFEVESGVDQMARHAFCDMCAKLNDLNDPVKSYDSMVPQWSGQACE